MWMEGKVTPLTGFQEQPTSFNDAFMNNSKMYISLNIFINSITYN